jgi:hypothetical protein
LSLLVVGARVKGFQQPRAGATVQVFVSYAREDESAVADVISDLKRCGMDVWWDRELAGGSIWWATILEHIRQCDVFVLAMSAASLESPACRLELEYAVRVWRLILPVLLEEVPNHLVPTSVARVQFVDFRNHRPDRSDQLIRAARALPPAPPLPPAAPAEPPAPGSDIAELAELVHRSAPLTVEEQHQAFMRLRMALAHPDQRETARVLLERLQSRSDTVHGLVDEITATLEMGLGWRGRPSRRQVVWLYIGMLFTAGILGIVIGLVYLRNPAWRPHAVTLLTLGVAWSIYIVVSEAAGLITSPS